MAKKKIVTTKAKKGSKVVPTQSKISSSVKTAELQNRNLVFGKKNYVWMIAGLVLIALGMVLMAGGAMPSPDVWDDSIAYSFRRITLAPILILAGLVIEIVAIFK